MALSVEQFFRDGGGELTLNHFRADEDPEEVVQGYITEAATKVAAVDAALQDGIAAKWVYYRAFQGAYAWVIMEPGSADTGDAGSVNFLDPEGLLKLALQYREEFDATLAVALSKPAARPYGPTLNSYVF